MSTATIALTTAEAEAIARANAALSWIAAGTFPWADARSDEIKKGAEGLRGSLDDYAGLTSCPPRTHPATLFFDLAAGHPDGALAEALDRVTEDIRNWTGVLVSLASQAEEAARMREEGSGQS